MKTLNHPASRPHDAAVVELLKEDPEFARVYLAAALEEAEQLGGQQALLWALRQVTEAQGMAAVAQRAGIPRESLYRAICPWQPDYQGPVGCAGCCGFAIGGDEAPSGSLKRLRHA